MRGDFPNDTFTQGDVEAELDRMGLKHFDKGRYLLAQCPTHEDKHPSVQVYKDDWFVNCHATCGRFHITKAFPSLRPEQDGRRSYSTPARSSYGRSGTEQKPTRAGREGKAVLSEHKYKTFDLMEQWKTMPRIPRAHGDFKTIPLEVLDDLGWRYVPDYDQYFIPYFSASKQSIPFAQYRNLAREPRFIMLKDAKPTCYGTWNLDNDKLFVVEGTSDCAVLEYAAVPWIGLPSAASTALMQSMADYCHKNGIQLVYAGDNDAAGEKLKAALDEITSYRVKQPPKEYKDWGDFLVATDIETVQDYCMEELLGKKIESEVPETISKLWPDAQVGKLEVDAQLDRKEQSGASTVLF